MKKKNKKWVRWRHKVVTSILRYTLGPFTKIKYGIKVERFNDEGKRNYLVLSNHQTAFDQFFLGMAFKQPLYYMASEDLFSNGFTSKLINYLVAPIPIKKSTNDVRAVMDCIRVAKQGGSVAIFPEGNRTFSGKTEHIKDTVAQLAKALKLPIALFHIEGGYGVHPRWSNKTRKGKMRAYVHSVIEPEEYLPLSNEELYERICQGIYVNEGNAQSIYKSKKKAEGLERAMYYCPVCGLSKWQSKGDIITCTGCGKAVRYTETTELVGVDEAFPYKFVTEWYDAQSDYVRSLDPSSFGDASVYSDMVRLFKVIPYKKKEKLLKAGKLCLFADRLEIRYRDRDEEKAHSFPIESISSMAVLGKNKINLYTGSDIYQITGLENNFCALKYVQLYYHFDNVRNGGSNGEFLGL